MHRRVSIVSAEAKIDLWFWYITTHYSSRRYITCCSCTYRVYRWHSKIVRKSVDQTWNWSSSSCTYSIGIYYPRRTSSNLILYLIVSNSWRKCYSWPRQSDRTTRLTRSTQVGRSTRDTWIETSILIDAQDITWWEFTVPHLSIVYISWPHQRTIVRSDSRESSCRRTSISYSAGYYHTISIERIFFCRTIIRRRYMHPATDSKSRWVRSIDITSSVVTHTQYSPIDPQKIWRLITIGDDITSIHRRTSSSKYPSSLSKTRS